MSKITISILVIALSAFILFGLFYPPPKPELGKAQYTINAQKTCDQNTRDGLPGFTDDQKSDRGIRYHVRTPKNYNKERAHPLLMVYSPGDRGGLGTERFTKLTTDATTAGYIIAYADNRPKTAPSTYRPITKEWISELGSIPKLIAKKWCIDEERIVLTGHSNGGTVTTALTILPSSPISPKAIIVSGAGWTTENYDKHKCPGPRPVMIMHSNIDQTFPGFGPHSAKFWSGCNRCSPDAATIRSDGCKIYKGCTAPTLYCEGDKPHTHWPRRNAAMMEFLKSIN